MRYISTSGGAPPTSFHDALFRGLAPDGGLYIPQTIPRLPEHYFQYPSTLSFSTIGRDIASAFIDEIPPDDLLSIVTRAWDFAVPLAALDEQRFLLELFHGPTLAFKDVGARFMAQTMSYFLQQEQLRMTIVVATSGDTGSAVAHGFFGAPNISVCILYPSGKVSRLQEQQMATLGNNIHALEIEGTFDDCQQLVKQALGDPEIRKRQALTTANSINLGRLIPQISYYIWSIVQLRAKTENGNAPVVVVPSGNFGNLTAGVYAKRMGAPIRHFIAATNDNDIVPQYLYSGNFLPRSSVQTYSNAMDVGNPSNFVRLQALYGSSADRMRVDISGRRITDERTLQEIRRTYESTGTILDPHTAVGVAASRESVAAPIIITSTAHPAKFPEVIRRAIGVDIPLPHSLQMAVERPGRSVRLAATYVNIKEYLLGMKEKS